MSHSALHRAGWRALSALVILSLLFPAGGPPPPTAEAAATAFRNPTGQAFPAEPGNDGFEASPANAFTDNGQVASNLDGVGDRHEYFDYGFANANLPANAVITGIEVRVDGRADQAADNARFGVELSWDGSVSWTALVETPALTASEATAVLGSATDLWGRTWARGEFTNANFSVRVTSLAEGATAAERDFFLEWVAVRVYYASALITGVVYSDANGNGAREGGEAGFASVPLAVYRDDGDGVFEGGGEDVSVATPSTSGTGAYSAGPLMDGFSYWVQVVTPPADTTLTTPPEPRLVTLAAAAPGALPASATADFGYAPPITGTASIALSKLPDAQVIASGATAAFTITVTNTGDQALSGVVVTDTLAANCNRNFALLNVGQAETFTCTRTSVTADFVNTAAVSATSPLNVIVTAADTANVDVVSPGLAVAKTPDNQVIRNGATVTFTVGVTNTGDSTLTAVTLTDPLTPNCNRVIASLAAGANQTYTCTRASVTADFVNTLNYSAQTAAGGTLSGSDTAAVDVINPAIDLAKTPDLQYVTSGGTVTFTIAVTNTGDSLLSNVTVTDPLAPNCNRVITSLAAGASQSHTCTRAGVTADFTNTASVSGAPATGAAVTDSDTAVVDVIGPALQLAKTPDPAEVVPNGTVTFTIAITNTGDVALSNVVITDPLVPACNRNFASLAVGASQSYTCSQSGVAAAFLNTANATCSAPGGITATASDTAQVVVVETLGCPSNLQAYWRLDETAGPLYADSYGTQNGSCAGQCPTTTTAGRVGRGQVFGGTPGSAPAIAGVNIPAPGTGTSFNWTGSSSFSIELWIKPDPVLLCSASNEVAIGRDGGPSGTGSLLHWWVGVACEDGRRVQFYLIDTKDNAKTVSSTTVVTGGQWYHLVAVRDAAATQQIRLYVNGVKEAELVTDYANNGGFSSPTAALNIGWLNRSPFYPFNGTVDEVMLYNRALTTQEIQAHYASGGLGASVCQANTSGVYRLSLPVIYR